MIAKACVRIYTKEGKRYDIPCHRHGDAFYIISQFLEPDDIDKSRTEQGFLTDKGEFLDRQKAFWHAMACSQIPMTYTNALYLELYSEDLW